MEFSKNIPKYLQEFRQLIDEFVESLRTALSFLSKNAQEVIERLKLDIRKTDTGGILAANPIVKNLSDDLHGVFYKGKKVFEGTKKQVNEFLEELGKQSDEEASRYLDDILTKARRKVQLKNPDELGAITKGGQPKRLNLIDELNNDVGQLIRSNKKRTLEYRLFFNNRKIDF